MGLAVAALPGGVLIGVATAVQVVLLSSVPDLANPIQGDLAAAQSRLALMLLYGPVLGAFVGLIVGAVVWAALAVAWAGRGRGGGHDGGHGGARGRRAGALVGGGAMVVVLGALVGVTGVNIQSVLIALLGATHGAAGLVLLDWLTNRSRGTDIR